MGGHRGGQMGGPMNNLTDAEKTALTSMTDAEKQTFFEKKHTEMAAKRDAREAVIDKLLAGTALTADEETIRKEIITERATHKAQETQMKTIRDKQAAGTALTTEEQAIVDSMPKMGGRDGKGGPMKGMMNRFNTKSTTTLK